MMPGGPRYSSDLRGKVHWNRSQAEQQNFPQDNGYFDPTQQCFPQEDLGFRRHGAPFGIRPHYQPRPYQQHMGNINVRFNNYNNGNRVIQYFEEPMNINSEYRGPPQHVIGAQSVREPNEDEWTNEMFSRRQYGGVRAPTNMHNPFPTAAGNVIDYNHQRPQGPGAAPRNFLFQKNKIVRPQKDPRLIRMLNPKIHVTKREVLACEVTSGLKTTVKCEHPRPKLFLKREKDVEPTDVNISPPNAFRAPSSTLLDRIEREKYEKAKNSKNSMKGVRAVDSICAIPRPVRDPELESEINIVIEKLDVPVITTPANFTNYKIPKATKGTEPLPTVPSSSIVEVAEGSGISLPVSEKLPSKDTTTAKVKTVTHNRPVNKQIPIKEKDRETHVLPKTKEIAEKPRERENSAQPKDKEIAAKPRESSVQPKIKEVAEKPREMETAVQPKSKEIAVKSRERETAVHTKLKGIAEKPKEKDISAQSKPKEVAGKSKEREIPTKGKHKDPVAKRKDKDSSKLREDSKKTSEIESSTTIKDKEPQPNPKVKEATTTSKGKEVVPKIKSLERVIRSSCDSQSSSGSRRGSNETSDENVRKSNKAVKKRVVIPSSESDSDDVPFDFQRVRSKKQIKRVIQSLESDSDDMPVVIVKDTKKRKKRIMMSSESDSEVVPVAEIEKPAAKRIQREDSRTSRSSRDDRSEYKMDRHKKKRRSESSLVESKSDTKKPVKISEAEPDKKHISEIPNFMPSSEATSLPAPAHEPHVPLISSSGDSIPNPKDLLERLLNTDPEILKQINSILNNTAAASCLPVQEASAAPMSPVVNLAPRVSLPLFSVPLSIDLPKAQSPTITSCQRIEDSPFHADIGMVEVVKLNPYRTMSNLQQSEHRRSISPKTSRAVRRSVSSSPVPPSALAQGRDSPRLKRNRKNELEKLQEDISRNFDLKFMMSERSTKQVKDVPKKIARRRQSMCSSLSTENGSIKLTISREPASKAVLKRRLSVGSANAPVFVPIEDDIRNDDPFYDLDSGNCRLCTKSTDSMVAHYIECHRTAEVFCSRIKYSQAMKLKRGESCNVVVNADTAEYVCLLCDKTQTCTTYYDIYQHLTSHTGEFYFKCTECDFRDVTQDVQHARMHKFEICPFPQIEDNKLIAFMCEKCHYVQLQKTNINKHIVCHHRDETTKPAFKEVVLIDFGSLKVANLDFDDLDGRFKLLPVIEAPDDSWVDLENSVQDHMNESPESDNEEDVEYGVDNVLERSFEADVKNLMAVAVRPPTPEVIKRHQIVVSNITYDVATKTFYYDRGRVQIAFTDYEKLKRYLEESIGEYADWSGHCNNCDKEVVYSTSHKAVMELLHLRNIHWHQAIAEQPAADTNASCEQSDSLRPWLSKSSTKTSAECEEMLNIGCILSTYKCMASDCHYYTMVMANMDKHLDMHDSDLANDDDAMIECCYCTEEFASPADYFTHIVDLHGPSQYFCPYCFYRANYANAMQHVKVYHPDKNQFILDGKLNGLFSQKITTDETLMDLIVSNVKAEECRDCNQKFFPLDRYQSHLEEHGHDYLCEICCKAVPVLEFIPHIASHNRGPFDCIYCSFGSLNGPTIKRHLIDEHCNEVPYVCARFAHGDLEFDDLGSIRLVPVLNTPIELLRVKVVPKNIFAEIEMDAPDIVIANVRGGIEDSQSQQGGNSTTRVAKELDKFILNLPEDYVFERPIKCPKCDYTSAVRLNLVRHFNMHNDNALFDQENDPVNRVGMNNPSAEVRRGILTDQRNVLTEKPAAKIAIKRRMTISELSSPDADTPQYVPISQRFHCGIENCNYFAPEERTLMGHIRGVHGNESTFKCPHCVKVVERGFEFDVILSHYKLHDTQLHKCALCTGFYGDTRNTVSKHIRKRHKASVNDDDIIVVRGSEEERAAVLKRSKLMRRNSVASKRPRFDLESKFKCSYCPYEETTTENMISHLKSTHGYATQYQCMACKANLNVERGFKAHVTKKHNGVQPGLIEHFRAAGDPASMSLIAADSPTSVAAFVPQVTTAVVSSQVGLGEYAEIRERYRTDPVYRTIVYYCELCPQTFGGWDQICEHYKKSHEETVFNPQLPSTLLYSCLFCQFNTPRPATLADHFVRCHEKSVPLYRLEFMVKCLRCNFGNTAEKLHEHYKEEHPKDQPLMRHVQEQLCGLCAFRYNNDRELQIHFENAHKTIANQTLKVKGSLMKQLLNVKVDKKYKCKQCLLVLNNNQIRYHQHTSECVAVELAHRYRCRSCSFMTLDYEHAKAHVNDHKEQEMQCERCSTNFPNYACLMMHITSHQHVGDYMAELMKQYSVEIIFPNGWVTSEAVAAPALQARHYKCPMTTGTEV